MASPEVAARYALRVKREALEAYGGVRCVRCDENRLPALHLHHVDVDGAAHRSGNTRGDGKFGKRFYARLRREGWPTDRPMEVVCANCHAVEHCSYDKDLWDRSGAEVLAV